MRRRMILLIFLLMLTGCTKLDNNIERIVDIVLNEENKGLTCANGKVLGKVWYNTSITVNRNYEKKVYTGKTRFNFSIKNKILRNRKFNKFDKEYKIKNNFFSIYKEKEYKLNKFKYDEEDSLNKALKEVDNKFKSKLGENGKILTKKVLSKDINESNISLTLFVMTEEEISKKEVLNLTE